MPEMLSPDVYVREVSTGGRAIQGVGTATGAFLGLAERGPIGAPVLITSFDQYIDTFGSFKDYSYLTDEVYGFFLNGGRSCWVSRTGHYADTTTGTLEPLENVRATKILNDRSAGLGTPTLQVTAVDEGEWGNNLAVTIAKASGDIETFNRVLGNDGGTFAVNTSPARTPGLHKAFTEEASVFTDRTTVLRTVGGGAPFAMPAAPSDASYFGSRDTKFSKMYFDLDVSGVAGSGVWQYWNGAAWAAFTPSTDQTTNFTAAPADNRLVEFTAPSDWQRNAVNGQLGFYVRFFVTTTYTTPAEISRLTLGEDRPFGVFTPVASATAELAGATALEDAFYLGSNQKFGYFEVLLATPGDVTGVLALEYWNGTTWAALTNITETATGAQHLRASGVVGWTIPANWRRNDVNGEIFYWIRGRITTNYASDYPSAEHLVPQSDLFQLRVVLNGEFGIVSSESYDNLTLDPNARNYVEKLVGTVEAPVSRLIHVSDLSSLATPPNNRPFLQSNTLLAGGVYDVSNVTDADYIGSSSGQSGLFSFDPIDEMNMLSVPGVVTEAVHLAMINYCENRLDLMTVLDSPGDSVGDRPQDLVEYVRDVGAFNSSYAAIYDYWLKISDPISGQLKIVPYSGFVMGMYARTDFNRGVWKSPAGTEDGLLRGALGLVRNTSKGERDLLYQNRINPIRDVAGTGVHVDGGKTLAPANSDFSRIAIRRLFLFLEESIQEGIQFLKHEPNDDRTWRSARGSIGQFLASVWLQKGLFGTTPEEAFFVVCDESLNTPIIRSQYIMRIRVGVAPLQPAEFIDVTFEVDKRAINEELATFGVIV